MASRLRRDQDRLGDRDHRQRFITAVDAWPRLRGADGLIETQIQHAGMLLSDGLSNDEIAAVLGVTLETLRRRRILVRGETWRREVLHGERAGDGEDHGPKELWLEGCSAFPA